MDAKLLTKEEIEGSIEDRSRRRQPLLGNRIREIRRAKLISFVKMCADIGIDKRDMSLIERGLREVPDRDKIAISAYLGESILDVFFHEVTQ
jgi:transcriptional regulator with XRE-family HTH domain